jgi:hypothetical protein
MDGANLGGAVRVRRASGRFELDAQRCVAHGCHQVRATDGRAIGQCERLVELPCCGSDHGGEAAAVGAIGWHHLLTQAHQILHRKVFNTVRQFFEMWWRLMDTIRPRSDEGDADPHRPVSIEGDAGGACGGDVVGGEDRKVDLTLGQAAERGDAVRHAVGGDHVLHERAAPSGEGEDRIGAWRLGADHHECPVVGGMIAHHEGRAPEGTDLDLFVFGRLEIDDRDAADVHDLRVHVEDTGGVRLTDPRLGEQPIPPGRDAFERERALIVRHDEGDVVHRIFDVVGLLGERSPCCTSDRDTGLRVQDADGGVGDGLACIVHHTAGDGAGISNRKKHRKKERHHAAIVRRLHRTMGVRVTMEEVDWPGRSDTTAASGTIMTTGAGSFHRFVDHRGS